MKLFWDQTGPLITYHSGVLQIEDLNPSRKIVWRMTRLEMCRLGLRCLIASLRRNRDSLRVLSGGISGGKVSGKGLYPVN